MFHGSAFIYDQTTSEMFDLRIFNLEFSGTGESQAIGTTTLIQKWLPNKKRPYHFNTSNVTPLTFEMTIGSYNPLTATDRSRMGRWLLGKTQYKKLQIVSDDMLDSYFNVIFTDGGNFYSGNIAQGIKLFATCDSPWPWTLPRTKTFTFDGDVLQDYNFTFYNDSDDNGYLLPDISFTISNNVSAGDFTLTNITDSSRAFTFTGLDQSEQITVDNDKQIITSSDGNLRLGDFNKNWFRLLPGNNQLNIAGYLDSFSMTYSFARIIGG